MTFRVTNWKFTFQLSMEGRRFMWLNSRQKFYRNYPLREFNLGRKNKGWRMISIFKHREQFKYIWYPEDDV